MTPYSTTKSNHKGVYNNTNRYYLMSTSEAFSVNICKPHQLLSKTLRAALCAKIDTQLGKIVCRWVKHE